MTATNKNGPEPPIGSWVIASIRDCSDRYFFQHIAAYDGTKGRHWFDQHGCVVTWDELIDPIDTLPPTELADGQA